MKYFEITAKKGEQELVERMLENGERYLKYLPVEMNTQVYIKTKEAFQNKPVKVEMLSNGWIKVTKTSEDKQLADAAEKVLNERNQEFEGLKTLANAERDLLTRAGYKVTLMEYDDE